MGNILTTTKTWRRELARPNRSPDLSDDETAAAKRALRFLFVRLGGAKLATALRVHRVTLTRALGPKGRPGAAMVLRCARLAHVHVEDILGGAWPPEGACPHCGRR